MNDDERRLWVLNDEQLYLTWRRSGYKSMRAFLKANRGYIDAEIKKRLEGPRRTRSDVDQSFGRIS